MSDQTEGDSTSAKRPSVEYQPILRLWEDKALGQHWRAKYWDVEGIGQSPAEAMADFDRLWSVRIPGQTGLFQTKKEMV